MHLGKEITQRLFINMKQRWRIQHIFEVPQTLDKAMDSPTEEGLGGILEGERIGSRAEGALSRYTHQRG